MTILFSRKLNIQAFTRTIGSKLVRVSPHSRKAGILRARKALKNISKSKVEVGYIVSKSGKLSKKFTSNSDTFLDHVLPTNKGKSSVNLYGKDTPSFGSMHNHPKKYSPPSSTDYASTIRTGQNELIISKEGSTFRIGPGKRSENPQSTAALVSSIYGNDGIKNNPIEALKDISGFKNYPEEIKQQLRTIGSPTIPDFSQKWNFLLQDTAFKKVNKSGRLLYRSKLTPDLKDLQSQYSDHIESLFKNSNSWREFSNSYLR